MSRTGKKKGGVVESLAPHWSTARCRLRTDGGVEPGSTRSVVAFRSVAESVVVVSSRKVRREEQTL